MTTFWLISIYVYSCFALLNLWAPDFWVPIFANIPASRGPAQNRFEGLVLSEKKKYMRKWGVWPAVMAAFISYQLFCQKRDLLIGTSRQVSTGVSVPTELEKPKGYEFKH